MIIKPIERASLFFISSSVKNCSYFSHFVIIEHPISKEETSKEKISDKKHLLDSSQLDKFVDSSMSTQKMSYFSDIDLATLHRSRLNERIQYKLSWFNRRQKYCIPAVTKSVCKRNNAPPTTETQKLRSYANNTHKFNANTKNVRQSINGVNEMEAPALNSSDEAKIAATAKNRQRKNGYTSDSRSKKKTSTSLNDSSERLNHLDASTTLANEIVYANHNEPAILSGTHVTNGLLVKTNNNKNNKSTCTKTSARKCDEIEIRTSLNQTTDQLTRQNSHGCQRTKCSSADSAAINRTTQTHDVSSNKRNAIRSAAGANIIAPVIVEQIAAIEEEDLDIPHRKRSGTWP